VHNPCFYSNFNVTLESLYSTVTFLLGQQKKLIFSDMKPILSHIPYEESKKKHGHHRERKHSRRKRLTLGKEFVF
jgi:hypothetical protein